MQRGGTLRITGALHEKSITFLNGSKIHVPSHTWPSHTWPDIIHRTGINQWVCADHFANAPPYEGKIMKEPTNTGEKNGITCNPCQYLIDSVGQAFHILSAGYCSPGQLSCFRHIPRVSRREALPYEHTVFLGHLYI